MTNLISEFALDRLGASASSELCHYSSALRGACEAHPPPYGNQAFGESYRRMAEDPSWFASLLASNADLEGYSAKRLWSYARTVTDPNFASGLRTHALDEARHSHIFASLLSKVFPTALTAAVRERLSEMAPRLSLGAREDSPNAPMGDPAPTAAELLDSAILINLFETKALILEELLRPTLLAYCPRKSHATVERMLDALITDEVRHIRYTADYIELAATAGHADRIFKAMSDFQWSLNTVTLSEVEESCNDRPGDPEATCESTGQETQGWQACTT
jgi:hypothetical protein